MIPTAHSAVTAAVVAFVSTVALVPAVRAFCVQAQLFDSPGPLKTHRQPVPRLGGFAIFIGIAASAAIVDPQRTSSALLFFAALVLVWAAGFVDDLRSVAPALRVAAQFAAGGLLWMGGWHLIIAGGSALSLVATGCWVVALANAMNLLDGMDALAPGVAGIIAASYLALPGACLSPLGRAVAASMAGACGAFLIYNWPPAKIFLGDSGSTILGFGAAFLGLDFYRGNVPWSSSRFFPFFVAAVPLLDAVLAAFRRLLNRAPLLYGDRRHSYDILSAKGWPVRRTIAAQYAVTIALAAIGLRNVWSPSPLARIALLAALGLLLFGAIRLGSLQTGTNHRTNPP